MLSADSSVVSLRMQATTSCRSCFWKFRRRRARSSMVALTRRSSGKLPGRVLSSWTRYAIRAVTLWMDKFESWRRATTSVENQKGGITIQWCSIEKQKGAITIDCTAIAPFWFSTEHLWILIAPFWFSTGNKLETCNHSMDSRPESTRMMLQIRSQITFLLLNCHH